nr:MAG TPA: hypothetical protein [Caudoviricetes sp.]
MPNSKFPFIEQFNTLKEQPPRLLLFLYPRAARLFFYAHSKEVTQNARKFRLENRS